MSRATLLIRLSAMVALVLGLCACATPPTVELRGARFTVEIADDDRERERGLMFRTSLAPDAGMLFLFDEEEPRAFWMKNCKIALDILYFDSSLKLVGQALEVPPCSLGDRCPSYPSGAAARYVLEINPGTARRLGVQLGDVLTVQGIKLD
jgi:uncharacterized membrane protein (UPF0127 family)